MPTFERVAIAFGTCFALLAAAKGASAGGMEPVPERLVLQPPGLPANQSCQSVAANPESVARAGLVPNAFACRPDNAAWRNLMAELGFAIAPTAFHPARTTGIGGFALTLEANFTKISANAATTRADDGTRRQYWHDGTQGATDPATKQSSIVNNSPDSLLQVYSLKARKGLPFGFEATGAFGFMANTNLWVFGADIRWALLEGFRTGVLRFFPDVSVGGGVRTLAGSSKYYVTTIGIDAQVSKPFALADSAVLTPYVGYQRLIILADSTVVDSTPNVDALQQCGYDGPDPNTGKPRCRNTLSSGIANNGDFNNHMTFDKARIHRHRGLVGVNYRYEILYLGGQIAFDLQDPSDENPGLVGDRQFTLSLEGGVFF